MAVHDVLVFDDDSANLGDREWFAREALGQLPDALRARGMAGEAIDALGIGDWSVLGFLGRSAFLEHVADRAAANWAFGLIDLQATDSRLAGLRMIRTIREHDSLKRRCMPMGLTIHATPGMLVHQHPYAFAMIKVGSPDVVKHMTDALATMISADRYPMAAHPNCQPFPPVESPEEGSRLVRDRFQLAFGMHMMPGDELILRDIALDIPNTVTDRRLGALGERVHRRSVQALLAEILRCNPTWQTNATAVHQLRNFVSRERRGDADTLNPVEATVTAREAWAKPETRHKCFFPRELARATDTLFTVLDPLEVNVPDNNAKERLPVYEAARRKTAEQTGMPEERLEHAVACILDVVNENRLPAR